MCEQCFAWPCSVNSGKSKHKADQFIIVKGAQQQAAVPVHSQQKVQRYHFQVVGHGPHPALQILAEMVFRGMFAAGGSLPAFFQHLRSHMPASERWQNTDTQPLTARSLERNIFILYQPCLVYGQHIQQFRDHLCLLQGIVPAPGSGLELEIDLLRRRAESGDQDSQRNRRPLYLIRHRRRILSTRFSSAG